ncbi:glycerol-3-phosphate dehydrogenase/oxidase [Arthrobacter sp. FW306-07-I]|uniref:glycerol-3-phosphate dehydrogenase/oxidase n=1 Tax=Arthrobacter sp. FW306-07-I TaxID=2879622 RepID=UPI001F3D9E88|nr:glycerol-3-phosphate dehydrogenase/oxidase [Arthrobacter sp. FW306-07-I]UKA77677.1 glycerol-3-phosphate dehydrogenase/oxidase [Arthrobacter sp. FW306-07-I]
MALDPVDILVIGGGVNGLAVAREASSQGWLAAVVDAEDFGAGTSGTASRLVHGGIRYLENLEFHLVRESLRERERLLQTAPHLVKPYPLLIPFYRHNQRSGFIMRLGMFLYDVLSFDKSTPLHKPLSKAEVELMYPGLESDDLYGAVLYHDAQVANAERLCIEQALDVASFGGRVHNHLRVTGLNESKAGVDVRLTDTLTGRELVQSARVVVNASGPWVDMVLSRTIDETSRLIGGTKGSHMTVGPFPGAPETGVHYEAVSDGRAILVLPLPDGNYLLGSTDIFFEGDPADAIMTDEEITYLLKEVNTLIPQARLTPQSVLHTVSGVRPLPYSPEAKTAAEVSRNHHVIAHPTIKNLFSISGGKLTTHRALGEMAMNVVEKHTNLVSSRRPWYGIFRSGPGGTKHLKLPGARCADWGKFQKDFLDRTSLPTATAQRLLGLYGVRVARIESLICADPSLAAPLPGHNSAVGAEVVLAVREEFARTLIDIVARRMLLSWADDAGLRAVEAVAEIAARELQWDEQRVHQEVEAYHQWIRLRRPRALEDASIMLSNLDKYPSSMKKSEQ